MKLRRLRKILPDRTKEHAEIKEELDTYRVQMEQSANRLRLLEIEAGIYKPSPIRRKDN